MPKIRNYSEQYKYVGYNVTKCMCNKCWSQRGKKAKCGGKLQCNFRKTLKKKKLWKLNNGNYEGIFLGYITAGFAGLCIWVRTTLVFLSSKHYLVLWSSSSCFFPWQPRFVFTLPVLPILHEATAGLFRERSSLFLSGFSTFVAHWKGAAVWV